jgi:hypothetical protein
VELTAAGTVADFHGIPISSLSRTPPGGESETVAGANVLLFLNNQLIFAKI